MSAELQQLRKDIAAHGRRLDNLQAEFNGSLLSKRAPTTKPKQAETLDAADERLAEELFQATNRRTVKSNREDVRDSNDPDERLAQSIFDAADGNAGTEGSTENISDEDEALAESIFMASGGGRN